MSRLLMLLQVITRPVRRKKANSPNFAKDLRRSLTRRLKARKNRKSGKARRKSRRR